MIGPSMQTAAMVDPAMRPRSGLHFLHRVANIFDGILICVRPVFGLVKGFRLLYLIRQPRRRFAHVELAGDDVCDEAACGTETKD